MPELTINAISDSLKVSAIAFFMFFGVFSLLSILWPDVRNQSPWRRDSLTDVVYWLFPPVVYSALHDAAVTTALVRWWHLDATGIERFLRFGNPRVAGLPFAVQALLILFVSDFLQYWLHRMFHTSWWWKFHAVHHSSEEVDWLSSARFHPVNFVVSFTTVSVVMTLVGFSPEVFVALSFFNAFYSAFVHANLSWTFGPLRYVLASPAFHRRHHDLNVAARNTNFAPTFPFLDLVFGTFSMPADASPVEFGVAEGDVPDDFIGQLSYPFRRR